MVLKHATREAERIIDKRREKVILDRLVKSKKNTVRMSKARGEVVALKKALAKKTESSEAEFNRGFVLSLILLCRSYVSLHQYAFEILQEAGYELPDFNHTKLDPTDREVLHKIFST